MVSASYEKECQRTFASYKKLVRGIHLTRGNGTMVPQKAGSTMLHRAANATG